MQQSILRVHCQFLWLVTSFHSSPCNLCIFIMSINICQESLTWIGGESCCILFQVNHQQPCWSCDNHQFTYNIRFMCHHENNSCSMKAMENIVLHLKLIRGDRWVLFAYVVWCHVKATNKIIFTFTLTIFPFKSNQSQSIISTSKTALYLLMGSLCTISLMLRWETLPCCFRKERQPMKTNVSVRATWFMSSAC